MRGVNARCECEVRGVGVGVIGGVRTLAVCLLKCLRVRSVFLNLTQDSRVSSVLPT